MQLLMGGLLSMLLIQNNIPQKTETQNKPYNVHLYKTAPTHHIASQTLNKKLHIILFKLTL